MLVTWKKAAAATTLAALAVIGGSAVADEEFVNNASANAGACFMVRDVDGYSPTKIGDRDGVNLKVGRDVYQMEFSGACPGAGESMQIRLQSTLPTGYVCSGADAHLTTFSVVAPAAQCQVSGLRKLTEAQVAALPSSQRP